MKQKAGKLIKELSKDSILVALSHFKFSTEVEQPTHDQKVCKIHDRGIEFNDDGSIIDPDQKWMIGLEEEYRLLYKAMKFIELEFLSVVHNQKGDIYRLEEEVKHLKDRISVLEDGIKTVTGMDYSVDGGCYGAGVEVAVELLKELLVNKTDNDEDEHTTMGH